MTVIFDRPYEFVPPYEGNLWPTSIQTFRLIDWHLRRKECVVDYELRHPERFVDSIKAGHGVLLAPNHCRYADPIVLGWLARHVNTHLFAMASWHLFNSKPFETFALRRMGAFSIFREGNDRQAIETAIDILATGRRPLVLFPEGTTNRTNDLIKPLLDGVSFIAHAAAKRRSKKGTGKVVMHPIGLKYLCVDDAWQWADEQLRHLEQTLSWAIRKPDVEAGSLIERLMRVSEAYLALKEIEYTGKASSGDLPTRRDRLIEFLLARLEERYGVKTDPSVEVRHRLRKIRTAISTAYFGPQPYGSEAEVYRCDADSAELAQFLYSFPDEYMTPGQITDTRVVETIQRIQEAIYGKVRETMPFKVVIHVDHAIEVSGNRPRRGEKDELLCQLNDRLHTIVSELATEARPFA